MTVLSVLGGKGPGPIEGEEPDRSTRPIYVGTLSADELRFYNEVKEFLGSTVNEKLLVQAIKSHGSQTQSHLTGDHVLNDVISLYFDRMETEIGKASKQVHFEEHLEAPAPAPVISRPSTFNTRATSTEGQVDVIDLASEEDKNTSKWSSVSRNILGNREEQDVIKAIEESLKDNQNIPGFAPIAQKDPENPHERRRNGLMPVGLKNIGNSCWFNVIAETLNHIPRFQRMLFDANVANHLNAFAPSAAKKESNFQSKAFTGVTTISLLVVLRRLAARLHASSRAYVDPSDALKTISDLNANLNKAVPCIGIQQDATEMLLRLIEWLEQAFKEVSHVQSPTISTSVPSAEAMDTNDENVMPSGSNVTQIPMAGSDDFSDMDSNANPSLSHPFNKLFHGSHVEIRPSNDGQISLPKLENSLQMINLDVTYDNLYDSLEAYHLSDAPMKEMWFESLPPIIIFSLVRFSYKNGQTEKVHSKFQFPCNIYMDRYLYRNRNFVNEKRIERNALKERLISVKKQLERWEKYPVGDVQLSLPSLLNAVVKYTSSVTNNDNKKAVKLLPMEICEELPSDSDLIVTNTNARSCSEGNEEKSDFEQTTIPVLDKSVIPNDTDISVVNYLLRTLSADAQQKIDDLQKEANALQEQIDSVFSVEGMQEEPYRLHSVIVHEGEANVGHYWAYISGCPSSKNGDDNEVIWRKFNDSTVETATWQQIEEDAFGSRRTCSAYCLVYIRKKCEAELFCQEEAKQPAATLNELINDLPNDLRLDLMTDNALFDAEILKWDKMHPVSDFGPKNRPELSPSIDVKLLEMVSFKGPVDMTALQDKHYEYAGRLHGQLMVKIAIEALSLKEEVHTNRDETALSLIQEILANYMEHYKRAYKMTTIPYADRVMFMLDWARIFGVSICGPARSIFLLRMLSHVDLPAFPKLAVVAESVLKKVISDNNDAVDQLNDVHILYELFCQTVTVMYELIKKINMDSGSKSLQLYLQHAKFLCASIRMMDKIEQYVNQKSVNIDEKQFFHLVHNMLMIICVIRINRILIEQISNTSSDTVIEEHAIALQRDFLALIARLRHVGNAASEKTAQYVISMCNNASSTGNHPQMHAFCQRLMEVSKQQNPVMPETNLNVSANSTGQDVYCLRQVMRDMNIRTADDLNSLLGHLIQVDRLDGAELS